MSTPAARVLDLLELLQSAGIRTVPELAARLAVDERTVRRDITRLRDLAVPVETVRGRYGGYRLAPGYRMPPLMLSEEEAVAALVALTLARVSGPTPLPVTGLATATAKIRRSLPARLAQRAQVLLDTAVVDPAHHGEPVDPELVLTAADAIHHHRPLAMTYGADDPFTSRTLHPHDLVAYRGRWYLVGLDPSSQERRTFRLDRVRKLRVLPGGFPPPPAREGLADLVAGFAHADRRHLVRLRIHADAAHITRHLPPSVAVLEELDPPSTGPTPWHRVTIRAERLTWLPGVLLALDRPVVVEEPDELRAVLAGAAERLRRLAAGQDDDAGGATEAAAAAGPGEPVRDPGVRSSSPCP